MAYCNYPVLKITSAFEMDFSTSPRKKKTGVSVLPLNLIRKINPKYKQKHCLALILQSRFSSGAHISYYQ